MKIDLHVHTAEHSKCSPTPAVEMLRTAQQRGLDGIVITDHHHQLTEQERRALEAAVPGMRVFRGIETGIKDPTLKDVNWEDLLIISEEPWTGPQPVLASNLDVLNEYTERTGALTVLAHPFRYHEGLIFDLEQFCPDAIEIASSNVSPLDFDRILAVAQKHGMKAVSNTDAHTPNLVGLYYLDFDEEVRTEREIAEAVRAGRFSTGVHEATFQARVEEIEPQETLAREILKAGGDIEAFVAQGGKPWAFTRVASGATHMPDPRMRGWRNPK